MLATNARIDRDTPKSFVDRMAAGLRAHAQAKRDAVPPSSGYSEVPAIAGRVDMLASWVGAVDTTDPRLYALMQAASMLRDPDDLATWKPGVEMARVLSRLGIAGEFQADAALTELTCSALEDIITLSRYELARAESELGRLRAEVEEMWPIKAHIDAAKARRGVTQMSREVDIAAAARDARNAALAAAREEAETPLASEDSNGQEELPTGVRRRGKGFQAFARVRGEQRQATFATVDDAVLQVERWVQEREQEVAA